MQKSAASADKDLGGPQDLQSDEAVRCPSCQRQFVPERAYLEQNDDADDAAHAHPLAVDHQTPTLTQKAQYRGSSPLARLVRWLSLSVVLIAATVATLLVVIAVRRAQQQQGLIDHSPPVRQHAAARPVGEPIAPAVPEDSQQADRIVEAIERAVVAIETSGPSGVVSLGSGFVVDASGLVATNHHVLAEATDGQVRFRNGTKYEIDGYAAVRPDDDLAIIRLRDPPPNLRPLEIEFDSDPPRQAEVVAAGHPDGVDFSLSNGKVSQVLRTSRLSARAREFLGEHLRIDQEHRWIQHTAVLNQGNSGGPLLDSEGIVIGINTWVDKDSGFGYALHSMYLSRIMREVRDKAEPLEQYATQQARFAAAMQRLSGERVQRLLQEAETMRWAPSGRVEYQTLQQLARAITQTRIWASSGGSTSIRDELLEPLIQKVDAIETRIEEQAGQIFQQLTLLNEFAAKEMFEASEGLVFVATVVDQFEGDNGQRGMLVTLSGSEQRIFVPLNDVFLDPQPGSHYLIFGLNQEGQVVRFGDNPLRLDAAPVVVSRTLIRLE